MTEAVTISLIGAGLSLATAVLGAIVTVVTLRMKTSVVTLEKNTNHIKDALVKVTAEAEHAKGKIEGKAEEKQKQFNREQTEEGSG